MLGDNVPCRKHSYSSAISTSIGILKSKLRFIRSMIFYNMRCVVMFVRRRIQLLVFADESAGCTPEAKSTAYLTLVRPKLEYQPVAHGTPHAAGVTSIR